MNRNRLFCAIIILLLIALPFSACGAVEEKEWVPVRESVQSEPALQKTERAAAVASMTQSETETVEQTDPPATDHPEETAISTFPTMLDATVSESSEATEETSDRTVLETDVETADGEQQITYIANTKTKKFHLPTCSSVTSMNESNKWYFTGTRDELIEQDYQPCKRCNP